MDFNEESKKLLNENETPLTRSLYNQAMDNYQAAIHLEPQNVEFIYARGLARMAHNKLNEAMEDFDKVIEINPEFHLAYYQLGVILNQLGMRECNMELGKAAIRYFQKAESLGNGLAATILTKMNMPDE